MSLLFQENITSSNSNKIEQKIEFNGKEYQDELSLNWYDYGARNYDPTVGHWFNVDALAENTIGGHRTTTV